MTEKESKKVKRRTGKLLSSFVALTIVLSVLAVTMLPASAAPPTVTRTIVPDTPVNAGDEVDVTISFTTTEDMTLPLLADVVPFGWDVTDWSADPAATISFNVSGDHTVGYFWGTLGSGVAVTASYKLHVPVNAVGGIYPLNGALYNLGSHYADVTGDDNVTVTGPVYGVELTVDQAERTVAPNVNATYTLTVKNTGNTGDTFDIAIDNVPAGATATLSEGVTPELAPDGTYDVSLNVSSAIEDEYIVNVTATSQGDPSKSDKVTTKTNVSLDLPDLIVTEITPNCDYLFANESNNINATIKNNGTAAAGAFNVSFVIDGFSEEVRIAAGLAPGANTTKCVIDPTLRNAGDLVSINVTADCNGEVSELNETNNWMNISKTVMNNGYKNKSFMGMDSLELFEYDEEMYGGVVYNVSGTKDWKFEPGENQTRIHHIDIPVGMTVKKARLYVYWYDYFYNTPPGCLANLSVNFSGTTFTAPDVAYTDQKGFGDWNTPKGTYAYNVTSLVSGSADYTVVVENIDPLNNTAILGEMLLVVYEDPAEEPGNRIQLWLLEGNDLLLGGDKYCASTEEATATVAFPGIIEDLTNKSATLISVVAQGMEPGANMIFNGTVIKPDAWDSSTEAYLDSKINVESVDVTANLGTSSNNMGFQDTGTTGMQASNAILVVEEKPPVTEYNVTLELGWNMIGVPLDLNNYTLPEPLSSIEGKYECVGYYNATIPGMQYYFPAHPEWSTLKELEPGAGYWINMTEHYNLTFEGKKFVELSRYLESGWNMFSIPYGIANKTLPSALSSIDSKYECVGYYNATIPGMQYYFPAHPEWSTLKELEPGAGYWINMTEAAMFEPDIIDC